MMNAETRNVERPWDIGAAVAQFALMAETAEAHGYLLAVYGSVVKAGVGRDLDLLAVPKIVGAYPAGLIRAFVMRCGMTEIGPLEDGVAALSAILRSRDGRIVDLQIRGWSK